MELTVYTDYAFRVLMYLAVRPERLCSIAELAHDYRISRNHLVKVVHGLARGGFLRTYRGRGGGVRLARPPAEIRIGDVMRYTEGPVRPVECFRAEDNRCVIAPACGLPRALNEAFGAFFSVLDRYTLADLVDRRAELRALLQIAPPAGRVRRKAGARRIRRSA